MQIEISRRCFKVKRTQVLAAFLGVVSLITIGAISLSTTGCGVSDSIKSLQIGANGNSVGGSYNLSGVGAVLQLNVMAVYHSGKLIDVTNDSVFSVGVPPNAFIFTSNDPAFPPGPLPAWDPTVGTISKTGLMTGIAQICTWVDPDDPTKTPAAPFNPPKWEYTGYYQVTASYRGFTSQPLGVGIGIATSNVPGCGP